MVLFSGLGIYSATTLLRLPSAPNCPAIFWPTASASLRIYCARLAADKRTVDDLLFAISLVNDLPQDHPLRSEIDHKIEAWSGEILDLGEESFQVGDLDKAIDAAQKIPANTAAHGLVQDRITRWQKIWKKAEAIYQKAEAELNSQDLRQAFRTSTQLLGIGNRYWENTKYRQLNDLIVQTRIDNNKLDKAKGLMEQGGLSNLLAAVKLVQEIKPESHVYSRAQGMLADLGRNMLDLADAALDRRDYDTALKIARQIPESAKMQEEVRDFSIIAEARSQAWGGTVDDLQAAIVNVQRIRNNRPLYGKAQMLVSRWQLEIKDVAVLSRARQLAQPGSKGDLSAAIVEAQRIPFGNPRRDEAEKAIGQWQGQIETSEDQPYLDRAEQFAAAGDLSAAIKEASRIGSGRALYDKANRRIDDWTTQIQRSQDQPFLDRAQQLANSGDLEAAIASARQIGSGRALSGQAEAAIRRWTDQLQKSQDQPYLDQARQLANQGNIGEAIDMAQRIGAGRTLYDDAQAEIRKWRKQNQGQDPMRQAYNAASIGTPQMLATAIEIASQIPSDNAAHAEASRMIDQWSYQLLQMAEVQSSSNLSEAIAIAERVPSNTAAYKPAQRDLQTWRQLQKR
jgi:soluble cytochrome b562